MKRMNEVFELPINAGTFEVYGYIPVNGVRLSDSLDADEHAAHAINNVDALADALEKCMPHMQYLSEISGVVADINYESIAALKAYRGEK
jgi:hypothetical protein